MLGIKFYKADPSTFVMLFKNGKVTKQGAGTSFYYYAPSSSLVAVPLSSCEVPFAFRMKTQDFQEITLQGQVTFRIAEPQQAATMVNFTLDVAGRYVSEDPDKLEERVLRSVQVVIRNQIETMSLQQALRASRSLTELLQQNLPERHSLKNLGIDITEVSLTSIVPNPETAKALEADVREQLLKDADSAIYTRRLASIDQEKQVQERELETEKAINKQQQELEQQKLQAEQEKMRKKFAMDEEALTAKTEAERRRNELVELEAVNTRARSDAKAYDISSQLKAYDAIDIERLKVMSMSGMKPETLIAQALENLTKGDNRVGNLNISPELLQSLVR
ncbi:SPFH domain-containing protein [Shewanella sp.]|uniref:SPFH domain-containing protein n=1 Tax=Shewanella sp. TaxID=50422 RepID=UPI003A96C81C